MPSLRNVLLKFEELGCENVYFKFLVTNDNSKNQIYLGGSFEVLQILPVQEIYHEPAGEWEKERFKTKIDFSWLDMNTGNPAPARHSNLILYPKYPEVRLSGFLLGCRQAPSEWLRDRQSISDISILENGRIFLIGVNKNDGKSYGYLDLAGRDSYQILSGFHDIETIGGALRRVPRNLYREDSTRVQVIDTMLSIHAKGFIRSKRLNAAGNTIEYNAANGGGYTLEAELGIIPNAESTPDFRGWEVKQIRATNFDNPNSAIVTLMTPEPDGGLYHDNIGRFMQEHGYPDRRDDTRINFGGIYKYDIVTALTNLTMNIQGYDHQVGKIRNSSGYIFLEDVNGDNASSWSFGKLLEHWAKKHNQTIYVPCITETRAGVKYYHYGNRYLVGEGTSFNRFITALLSTNVYLDPAIKYFPNRQVGTRMKKRNQFRTKTGHLDVLYDQWEFTV